MLAAERAGDGLEGGVARVGLGEGDVLLLDGGVVRGVRLGVAEGRVGVFVVRC